MIGTRHTATSEITGETFTRTSLNRIYTHCVVAHLEECRASGYWLALPACRVANWAGSLALAQKTARSWKNPRVARVEILPCATDGGTK